jgi:hypothetical protein
MVGINGGTIYGNNDKAGGDEALDGGAVRTEDEASFYMDGGAIIKNISGGRGGGVGAFGDDGFHFEGGVIIDNTAVSGGGVAITDNSYAGIHGGSVIGNRATSQGGGIYWSDGNYLSGKRLTFMGKVRITDNLCGVAASNVLYGDIDGSYLNVVDELDDSSRIGVSLKKPIASGGSRTITSGFVYRDYKPGVFFSDNSAYMVGAVGSVRYDVVFYAGRSTFDELQEALYDRNIREVVVSEYINIPDGCELDGYGKTIRVPEPYLNPDGSINENASGYGVFAISAGSKVKLENMTIIGGESIGAVYGANGSEITMEGVTVTRSNTGLYTKKNSKALLKNCTFYLNATTGNSPQTAAIQMGDSDTDAGCVCVLDNCSFTYNRAPGGALLIWGSLYANNTVMANNASVGGGSAITCGNQNKIYLMNCTVTGNVSSYLSGFSQGGIRVCGANDRLAAVNCIITDNYKDNGSTRSDVAHQESGTPVDIINCVYGELEGSNTVKDSKQDTSCDTACLYTQDPIRIDADSTTVRYLHPELVELSSGENDYYVPVMRDGTAASDGIATYFYYSDDVQASDFLDTVRMGYGPEGQIRGLGDISAPDASKKVTTYYGGGERESGVIGASAPEAAKAVLEGKSVWRTSADTATVKFRTSASGTYYYKVTDSEDAPDAEEIVADSIESGVALRGTQTIDVADLSAGAKYVHVVVKRDGLLSEVHTIPMPYDVYYFEDFDSYDQGVYGKQAGNPFAPLVQDVDGMGPEQQKVVDIGDESGKSLQLYGRSRYASHAYVPLPILPNDSYYVYEGKFNIDEAGTNDGIRFGFMNASGAGVNNEAGLMVRNNYVCKHFDAYGYDWGTVENDKWCTVKIVAKPSARTYDIYIDGRCYENIPCPSGLYYICFSAVWNSKSYFDDLKFYITSPVNVTFDSKGGSSVPSQVVPKGNFAQEPAEAPVLAGYTLKQWLLNGTPFDFNNTPVTEDITLTADWELNIENVVITTPSMEKMYDGTPLTCDGSGPQVIDVAGIPDTFIFVGSANGSQTDVGESSNTLAEGYQILDSREIDITDSLAGHITVVAGVLKVTPKDLIIKTGSAYKEYDGTPLTCSDVEVTGLIDGQTAVATTAGTITDVGSAPNTYVIDWGTTDSRNYEITEVLGTLTVTKSTHGDVLLTDTVSNGVKSEMKLQLPALDEGQSYVSAGIIIGGEVPELIEAGSTSLAGTTLTYKTTAQDPGASATITIPVTGGNYRDYNLIVTVSTDGMIARFKNDIDVFTYTGAKITPVIEVTNNGDALVPGVDYTVTYSGNINVTRNKTTGVVTAGGKVTIKGKGNLSDSKVLTFTILPKDLAGDEEGTPEIGIGHITIAAGQKATAPVITYGSYKLAAKDYTITDPMSGKVYPEAGEFTLEVEGKGNFTGKVFVPVHVKETKAEIKKLAVTVDTKTAVYYDPFATKGWMENKLASLITVYDSADKSKTPIEMDGNYVITYPSDVLSAGKKTINIVGIGPYTGSISKSITVKPLVVKDTGSGRIIVNQEDISRTPHYFVAGGVTLGDELRVEYANDDESMLIRLIEGTDYKVTYTNNKSVSKEGKPAEYSITFLGNYKGTPAIKNTKTAKVNVFTLSPKSIADEDVFDAYIPDLAYTGKPGTYYSAPIVTLNGSTIASSNYTTRYFHKEDEEYTEITSKNKLTLSEADTVAVIQARITAKGNYSGTIIKEYKVCRQVTNEVYDLSKARITIYGAGYNPANKSNKKLSGIPFNGYPRKVSDIDPETGAAYGKIVVDYKIGKTFVVLEEGVDYEVKYLNNINKGKAVIVINGTNKPNDDQIAFAGSKRTAFSITASSLKKYLKELLGL